MQIGSKDLGKVLKHATIMMYLGNIQSYCSIEQNKNKAVRQKNRCHKQSDKASHERGMKIPKKLN